MDSIFRVPRFDFAGFSDSRLMLILSDGTVCVRVLILREQLACKFGWFEERCVRAIPEYSECPPHD